MTDREKKYLSDVVNSIMNIVSFVQDIKSFDEYEKNFLVKAAVERHLAIIGEAINKFLKENPANNITSAKQIISLRNRLIHSYDNIDDRTIWLIVKKSIQPLLEDVKQKLSQHQ